MSLSRRRPPRGQAVRLTTVLTTRPRKSTTTRRGSCQRKGPGTWSRAGILTHQKHAESNISLALAIFKGRYVVNGNDEFDCNGTNVIEQARADLRAAGLSVNPISVAELRTLYAIEAAIAAERGYQLCIMIGDEALAYTGK